MVVLSSSHPSIGLSQNVSEYLDHAVHMIKRHIGVEGERQAGIANTFGNWEISGLEAIRLAKEGQQVNGPVIHHHPKAGVLKFRDNLTALAFADPDRKQMPCVLDQREC